MLQVTYYGHIVRYSRIRKIIILLCNICERKIRVLLHKVSLKVKYRYIVTNHQNKLQQLYLSEVALPPQVRLDLGAKRCEEIVRVHDGVYASIKESQEWQVPAWRQTNYSYIQFQYFFICLYLTLSWIFMFNLFKW